MKKGPTSFRSLKGDNLKSEKMWELAKCEEPPKSLCHRKARGIFFVVCTSPLLEIHGLKYDFDTFIEA